MEKFLSTRGSSSGPSLAANWSYVVNIQLISECVSTAGDVNGDGYCDIIIGANFFDNSQYNEGKAYVFDGSGTGISDYQIESNQAGSSFGISVATAGDVTGLVS